MSNEFSYTKHRNTFPLTIISQIDVIDNSDLADIEKILDLPEGTIDVSGVPENIQKLYGYKILIAFENKGAIGQAPITNA